MKFSRNILMGFGVGLLVGALVILGIRFATYHPAHTHYHANFSVFINGQREEFASPFYYEESGAGACTADEAMTPAERTHMHDNENDIVHVHDTAVTWGQFFQNLGWTVNDTLIQARDKVYLADATHKITFLIDGQPYQNVANEVIKDQSRLLVDYGDTSQATLDKEMSSVAHTAIEEDKGTDPAACQSNAAPTLSDRLHHLF
jgi:hypothetical protein